MIHKNNNVALLVHSCDRYEFLFKGFEFFFSKHWNFDINCSYYFGTETKNTVLNGFTNLNSGKGEWADRLVFLLKEKIDEKYILFFQEDMWLTKNVNPVFFNELFILAEKNNWKQIKLHSSDVYKTHATDIFNEGFNVAKIDNTNSDFLMSHQITLWDKQHLIQQLHKKEHPWRNERKGTKRLKQLNPEIYQIDYFSENGNKEINNNINPIMRSEYHTISVNGLLNNNIDYFIKELKKAQPEDSEYANLLEYNYINKLTHDGKPKPRKADIFKKIKNWVQN